MPDPFTSGELLHELGESDRLPIGEKRRAVEWMADQRALVDRSIRVGESIAAAFVADEAELAEVRLDAHAAFEIERDEALEQIADLRGARVVERQLVERNSGVLIHRPLQCIDAFEISRLRARRFGVQRNFEVAGLRALFRGAGGRRTEQCRYDARTATRAPRRSASWRRRRSSAASIGRAWAPAEIGTSGTASIGGGRSARCASMTSAAT